MIHNLQYLKVTPAFGIVPPTIPPPPLPSSQQQQTSLIETPPSLLPSLSSHATTPINSGIDGFEGKIVELPFSEYCWEHGPSPSTSTSRLEYSSRNEGK